MTSETSSPRFEDEDRLYCVSVCSLNDFDFSCWSAEVGFAMRSITEWLLLRLSTSTQSARNSSIHHNQVGAVFTSFYDNFRHVQHLP